MNGLETLLNFQPGKLPEKGEAGREKELPAMQAKQVALPGHLKDDVEPMLRSFKWDKKKPAKNAGCLFILIPGLVPLLLLS